MDVLSRLALVLAAFTALCSLYYYIWQVIRWGFRCQLSRKISQRCPIPNKAEPFVSKWR
jgi:hypothetical protein